MARKALLSETPAGLYCEAGDFYIDPRRKVKRAVVTHAHADHARPGHRHYLCSASGEGVLRERIGKSASIQSLPFGDSVMMGPVRVSLHPAGHILGSAQVRVEHRGEVWVVTGDYKTEPDPSCENFELVECHCLISESTFGLPVYRWRPSAEIFAAMRAWWAGNREAGFTSVMYAYSLGKAQRLLRGLLGAEDPILIHPTVDAFLPHYREAGVEFPDTQVLGEQLDDSARGRAMVIIPSNAGQAFLESCGPVSRAFASGWMSMRSGRRRQSMEKGFALSDHVDWQGILDTVEATGAERIGMTHGYSDTVVRYLREQGRDAFVIG